MTSVRTHRAGTALCAPVPDAPWIHQIVLPTPWPVGPVQVYLIDSDPLTLVDTGVNMDESRIVLESCLEDLGYALEDVERVVITHFHGDHLGQAESIRRANPSLEVCAHREEVSMIESASIVADETEALFREYGVDEATLEEQRRRQAERRDDEPEWSEPTVVDTVLGDGQTIGFKDLELEVVHTPGHTAGHLLLLEAESRSLMTGDTIMGSAVPATANYYTGDRPDPDDPAGRRPRFRGLRAYLESLRALRRRPLRAILPAHGGVIERPDRAIDDAILFYEVRVQRIERGLRTLAAMGQDVTGWELWKALFPRADAVTEMRNRMLMLIGAIDVLEQIGSCETERRSDGVLIHHHS